MLLHVVRAELELDVGLLDCGHAAALIDAGYRQTLEYFGGAKRAWEIVLFSREGAVPR